MTKLNRYKKLATNIIDYGKTNVLSCEEDDLAVALLDCLNRLEIAEKALVDVNECELCHAGLEYVKEALSKLRE